MPPRSRRLSRGARSASPARTGSGSLRVAPRTRATPAEPGEALERPQVEHLVEQERRGSPVARAGAAQERRARRRTRHARTSAAAAATAPSGSRTASRATSGAGTLRRGRHALDVDVLARGAEPDVARRRAAPSCGPRRSRRPARDRGAVAVEDVSDAPRGPSWRRRRSAHRDPDAVTLGRSIASG